MSHITASAFSRRRARLFAVITVVPALLGSLLLGPGVAAIEAPTPDPLPQTADNEHVPTDSNRETTEVTSPGETLVASTSDEQADADSASESAPTADTGDAPSAAPQPGADTSAAAVTPSAVRAASTESVPTDAGLVAADIPAGGSRDVPIAVTNATFVEVRALADPRLELRLVSPSGVVGVDDSDRSLKSVRLDGSAGPTGTWVARLVNRSDRAISATYEFAWREASVDLRLDSSLAAPTVYIGANPLVNGVGRTDLTIQVRLTNEAGETFEQTMVPQVPGSTGYRAFFDPIPPGTYLVSARMTLDGRTYSALATVRAVAAETIPPTVQYTTTPAAPNALGWFRYNVNARLVGSDNPGGSGVFRLHYRLDGGETQSRFTDNIVVPITGDGVHELAYWAEDAQQNISPTSTRTVRIDTIAPTITVGAPLDGAVFEIDEQVFVDFSCADERSGVLTCTTDLPSGDPLPTGTAGIFELDFIAGDRAGNITRQTITYQVGNDTTPPVVTAAVPDAGASGWHADAVDIALEATDDAGSVDSVFWRVSGPGPVIERSAPGDEATVRLTSSGVHRVEYWAVDSSGNESTPQEATVSIDLDGPDIVITSPAPEAGRAFVPQSGQVEEGAVVRVDFECTDALSGVATCTGSTPDGAMLPTDRPGRQVIVVTAEDAAGNRSERTVSYIVLASTEGLAATGADAALTILTTGGLLLAAGGAVIALVAFGSRRRRTLGRS